MTDHSTESQMAAPSAASPTGDVEQQLSEAIEKRDEYLDLLRRSQADFLNYKRRIEQERSERAQSIKAEVVLRLLPAFDDLERAVSAVPDQIASSDWVQGVLLVARKIRAGLETEGVHPIEAVGQPFDPWEHEAVTQEQSATYSAGTVTAILRPGYKLDGRVIRPAQVSVSVGPPAAAGA